MTAEERVLRLENAFAAITELVAKETTRTDVLLQLVSDHDARLNQQLTWLNAPGSAQANADQRIAALADAQIRTEETLMRLSESQARTDEALGRLTERVNRLADVVERLANRNSEQ